MIILSKMLKYNCNEEIRKEVITMSVYDSYYSDDNDLILDQMKKFDEDQIKKGYNILMAVLKDGTPLSGIDLGELIYVGLTRKNMKQLMPVLNAIYKANPKSFEEFGFNNYYVSIGSGKDLGLFLVEDGFDDLDLFYDNYDDIMKIIGAFCHVISETKVDLHNFPRVFKEVYDLNNEDDLKLWQKKNTENEEN